MSLSISRGSADEVQTDVYIISTSAYLDDTDVLVAHGPSRNPRSIVNIKLNLLAYYFMTIYLVLVYLTRLGDLTQRPTMMEYASACTVCRL